MTATPLRVVVWGEQRYQEMQQKARTPCPAGMDAVIATRIVENPCAACTFHVAWLDDPEPERSDSVLADTDMRVSREHAARDDVADDVVDRVHRNVLADRSLIVLHSAHHSKVLVKPMGTSCHLRWRSEHDRILLWAVDPTHPIAQGIAHPYHRSMGISALLRALALSCHPLPSIAVTSMSAGLCGLAQIPAQRGALVVAAVFTGQLSIGWSNDYLDAERDRAVQRPDKPMATGEADARVAGVAAAVALALTLVLSVLLGWQGGAAALVIVACGWAYNLGVKATGLSWLPYAIAFGTLPAVAALSATPSRWPAAWALIAGALLGVAAHLANVLPDLRDDLDTGVRGLVHRIGAKATALSAALILLLASAIILFGPTGRPDTWRVVGFCAAALVAAAAVRIAYVDPSSRRVFQAIILIAALDLLSFSLAGVRL